MRAAWFIIASVGCGRWGFEDGNLERFDDASVDVDADASVTDGSVTIDVPPNAVTVTLGERAESMVKNVTADTYVSNDTGESTYNYGTSDDLRAEIDKGHRILLRFDASSIPTSATVIAATLEVEIIEANTADVEVRPILEAWTEGTLDGSAGAPSYLERTAGVPWASVGCGTPSSAGSALLTFKPTPLGVIAIDLPITTVQTWITMPATNYGVIFYNTDTNSARIASSEEPLAQQPQLQVTYVP